VKDLYGSIQRRFCPLLRRYHRISVVGAENLPPPGRPALLAFNHAGSIWWDGLCIAAALPERRVGFIAHDWDSTVGWMRWFLQHVDACFLDRTLDDITAESDAVQRLARGELMAVFPEESYHTWRDRYTLFRFSPHVLRYADLAGAPILPCATIGIEEAAATLVGWKRRSKPLHLPYVPPLVVPARVTLEIGAPVTPRSLARMPADRRWRDEDYAEGARVLRDAVQGLIRRHRECRVSDVAYNDERRWF
jgi:1-acyl-sn-glycerol-3-phosphate acyltransferase